MSRLTSFFSIKIQLVTVVFALTLFSGSANAVIENIPTDGGWGGFIIFGGGFTDIESNTVAGNKLIDIGKESIDSINQGAQSDDTAHAVVSGQVKYTFGDQWQVYLGSSVLNQVTMDYAQQLAIRKQTDSGQKFSAGFLLNAAIPTEVWQDPYQTNGDRNDTDRDAPGLRLEWDKILGSGANLTLSYRDIDIDKERSGQFTTDVVCDAGCQNDLRRDGDSLTLEAAWAFRLSSRHRLRPFVQWYDDDRDGNAYDYDGYGVGVTWALEGETFTLSTTGQYIDQDYDNNNPIYGREQDTDGYVLNGNLFYKLSQDGRWQAVGTVTYGDLDSDIDFHDNKLFQFTLGAYFSFGNQVNRWTK
jgi:hypothetical protein